MYKSFLLISLLLIASQSAIARQGNDLVYGYYPKMAFLGVDDPDGDTDTSSDLQAFGVVVLYKLERDTRIMATLNIYDFELSPGFNQIGQDVETTSFAVFYQSQFKLGRSFKPWLGAGPVFNIDEFTNRVDTDSDGFLNETFSDREETTIGLGLIASQEWELNDSFSLGLNFEYQIPLDESLEGFTIGFSVLYE